MGKKCIPGFMCIENMTLFILFIILILFVYLIHITWNKSSATPSSNSAYSSNSILPSLPIAVMPPAISSGMGPTLIPVSARNTDPINNPYMPPLKNPDGPVFASVKTRRGDLEYQQVGILTRNRGGDLILPVMGRQIAYGRSKFQYYTMTTTGNMNTKLPITVNGKSCTSEYGCDEISTGDTVYVQGYDDTFRATIYESNFFSY